MWWFGGRSSGDASEYVRCTVGTVGYTPRVKCKKDKATKMVYNKRESKGAEEGEIHNRRVRKT